MSQKRDYYEALGVERSATTADIRKAYKRLALKYHPDKNEGKDEATVLFKEVTEAYQVLCDDDKRARYDQYGHAGLEGAQAAGGADFFSHFQDLFADFFGAGASGGGARARGPARGRDMRVEKQLTLEEAVLGCKKSVDIVAPVECNGCRGSGAERGSSPSTCRTCGGAGQVSTGRGFIVFTQTCPTCQGQGTLIGSPCKQCDGVGWEEKHRTVTVNFPAGIDQGHRLRVSGQGIPGPRGGPPGHLYVDVILAPHTRFERDGVDLLTRQRVRFPDAALGTTLRIELLDGTSHEVEIAPGTQPGSVVTVPNKGAPNVSGRGCGALHVVVELEVPQKLTKRARKLLEELKTELDGGEHGDTVRTA